MENGGWRLVPLIALGLLAWGAEWVALVFAAARLRREREYAAERRVGCSLLTHAQLAGAYCTRLSLGMFAGALAIPGSGFSRIVERLVGRFGAGLDPTVHIVAGCLYLVAYGAGVWIRYYGMAEVPPKTPPRRFTAWSWGLGVVTLLGCGALAL